MADTPAPLSRTFEAFFHSEKSGAVVLIACTIAALLVANSAAGPAWHAAWTMPLAGLTPELWVNDALMAVFFLFVGLELECEVYNGELSAPRKALLPIVSAPGAGIPMATDSAFALGVLSLLGTRAGEWKTRPFRGVSTVGRSLQERRFISGGVTARSS